MGLEIKELGYSELTEEERDDWGIDDYEGATLMRITLDGELIFEKRDKIEPEDVRFYRSLSYVPWLARKMFELGRQDAFTEAQTIN